MSTASSPSPGPSSPRRDSNVTAPFWLAHNRPGDIVGRCVHLPIGRRRLAICARCLALYPTIIVVLALQLGMRWGPAVDADWWLTFAGAVPALLHWGMGRLGQQPGRWSMMLRMLTGVLLGVALGRALLLYFMDPFSEVFWTLALVMFFGAISFEIVARMKLT